MDTITILNNLVEQHQILAYLVIFLGLVFEGEFTIILAGVLTHLGALNFWFSLLFILLGGLTKTLLGYYLGKKIHGRWHKVKFLKFVERRVNNMLPHFKRKPFWSIFISKFITGFNSFVILFSGFSGVSYRKYLKAEFSSTLVWAPLLLCLGHFFSYTALSVSREVSEFLLVVVLLIIGYIVFDRLAGWAYELIEEFRNNNNENGQER